MRDGSIDTVDFVLIGSHRLEDIMDLLNVESYSPTYFVLACVRNIPELTKGVRLKCHPD